MKQKSNDNSTLKRYDLTDVLKEYPTKKDLQQTLSNLPTKQDLKDELKKYATKADLKKELKKELSNYPTKADLNKELTDRLTASQNAFRIEMRHEFLMMKGDILSGISTFTNRILTALDPLIKDMETRQQERELAAAKTREIEEDISDLQKRVTKLEHS